MSDHKHLTFEQRAIIQEMISRKVPFSEIGAALNKHPSTIAKEVKRHLIRVRTGSRFARYNACIHRRTCEKIHVCSVCNPDRKYKKCHNCPACNQNCSEFVREICPRLLKPPYVCNRCDSAATRCTLEKQFYYADRAQSAYHDLLSESRTGFSLSEEELRHLDAFVTPLIQQSQSPHHICVTNKDSIMISESTLYRLIDANALSARNLDLSRKVRFRPRKQTKILKVDRSCRVGRKYEDFVEYIKKCPDTPVVELDSVEGIKGGKVLLTIHFVKSEMMLAFLRDRNDSQSVIDIFNRLYKLLGHQTFIDVFPVCLPDNGSEFSNPKAIEFNDNGDLRTRIFYCDPSAPYQKGSAERNHELIRMFIPKGTDLSQYSQRDISLMMDHINSYSRKSLGDKCPYEMFAFLYKQDVLDLLECHRIPPQDVTLNRSIFRREIQP